VGDVPFYLKSWAKMTHPFKSTDFQSIFTPSLSAVIPSERCYIITNRKSTMRFPMSRRWTASPKPRPSHGTVYRTKVDSFRKKVSGQFIVQKWTHFEKSLLQRFLCKNCQRQSCKAFTGLSNRAKMVDGDAPYYLKFPAKLTYPLNDADFSSNRYSLVLYVTSQT